MTGRIASALLVALLGLGVAGAQETEWDDAEWGSDPWAEEDTGLTWTGFIEGAAGPRLRSAGPTEATLAELRARAETEYFWKGIDFELKGDLGWDAVADDEIALLRELSAGFGIGDHIEVKAGRQVLTWGTGDLVFLNDLFPKDFVSFFIGRDDEYLKAAGNAAKVSIFTDWVNADLVWTPDFDPDEFITGERLSFFSPQAGEIVSPEREIEANTPDDPEFALRLFKTVSGVEYALYAYDGNFKQPNALTPTGELTFSGLRAYGASVRGNLGPGLANAEVSWYDSLDDADGDDPRIPNGQFRALAGYQWEAVKNFNVGLQYYLEWTLDHDALLASSPAPRFAPAERRHVFTNRLTWRLMRETFTLSAFTFYSPTDDDFYLRPYVNYRHSDAWQVSLGANIFGGGRDDTFFAQLEQNTNAYIRLRRYF